jgi:hypothetical protein
MTQLIQVARVAGLIRALRRLGVASGTCSICGATFSGDHCANCGWWLA